MFRFKKNVDQLITAPQGENKEEIDQAQAMVDAAQNAVSEMVLWKFPYVGSSVTYA